MIRLSLFVINVFILGHILNAGPALGSTLIRTTDTILPHPRRNNSHNRVTVHYFNQRVDHRSKFSGKFKQRYWLNAQSYQASGPIFLVAGGESDGEGIVPLIENGTIQVYTDVLKGASIVLEHRYFGKSFPYQDLSEKYLKHLTIQQAIDDLAYFANNVKLDLSSKSSLHPDNSPWIIVGSGYAGALSNWAMLQYEGLFAAGYASSAPVQAQENLWQYWDVILQKMPKECSSAVQDVSEYIDKVAANKDKQEEEELKRLLGLDGVTHMVDVANSMTFSLGFWNSIEPLAVDEPLFFQFCDALTARATDDGKSKLHATLAAWGDWNKNTFHRTDDEFWGSYNESHKHYKATNILDRQWAWLQCNELGWFATAAPKEYPTLVPRLLDVKNERRMCSLHFPETFKKLVGPRVNETNSIFGGWNKHAKKLVATTGAYDVWKEVSFYAGNAKKFDSDEQPLVLVENGFTSSELSSSSPAIRAAQEQVDLYLVEELKKWRPKKPSSSWRSWWSKLKRKLVKEALESQREA